MQKIVRFEPRTIVTKPPNKGESKNWKKEYFSSIHLSLPDIIKSSNSQSYSVTDHWSNDIKESVVKQGQSQITKPINAIVSRANFKVSKKFHNATNMGKKVANHNHVGTAKATVKKCVNINNNKYKSVPLKVAVNNAQCKEDIATKNKYWPFLTANDHDVANEVQNKVDSSSEFENTGDLTDSNNARQIKVGVSKKYTAVSCGDDDIVIKPDKYELHLRFSSQVKNVLNTNRNAPILHKGEDQVVDKYGFIPLSELLLPDYDNKNANIHDGINAHKIVAKSNTFNFMKAHMQVKSQLKPDIWEKYLHSYWDGQLTKLIRYGFPLDFNYHRTLQSKGSNHPSAAEFEDDVKQYLQEEIKFGAIAGPFNKPPFNKFHSSPFMTRPKPSASHKRVIIDLSFPHGHSVNDGIASNEYLGTKFILSLPNIDTITSKVRKLGKGSLLFKIDISRAFRQVKIDPRDYPLLGLSLDNYYYDICVPFGYRHGSAIFECLTDAIRYIMASKGISITNYIDDLIGTATPSQANAAFDQLHALL